MNSTLEGINSQIIEAEEQMRDREDRMVEITDARQNIEKRMEKNEDSIRDVWTTVKTPTLTL